MKSLFFVVILSLLALVSCLPHRYVNIRQKNQRVEKNIDEDGVHGSYTWRTPSGKIFFVKYVADELGYRIVESNVLPSTASGVRTDGYQGTSRSAEDDDFDNSLQTDEDDCSSDEVNDRDGGDSNDLLDMSLSDENELLDDSLDVDDGNDNLRKVGDNSLETVEVDSLENDSVYETNEEDSFETLRNADDSSGSYISVETVESMEDSTEDELSKRVNDINSIEDNSIETVESIDDSAEDDSAEEDSDKKIVLRVVDTDNSYSKEENDVDDSSEENVKVYRVTVDDADDQDDSSEEATAEADSQVREETSSNDLDAENDPVKDQDSNTDEDEDDDEDDDARTKYIFRKRVNDINSIEDNSIETVETIDDSLEDDSVEDDSDKKTIVRIVDTDNSHSQEENDVDDSFEKNIKVFRVAINKAYKQVGSSDKAKAAAVSQDDDTEAEDNEENEETQNEDENDNEEDESESDKENDEENEEEEETYSTHAEESSSEFQNSSEDDRE